MFSLKNIFFIGLMGAGKTTIGRLLAKQLGMAFYDTDHEIERKTGVKIPLIFELEGEAGFRKRETAILEELTQLENIVLATGGGAVPVSYTHLQTGAADILLAGGVVQILATAQPLFRQTLLAV